MTPRPHTTPAMLPLLALLALLSSSVAAPGELRPGPDPAALALAPGLPDGARRSPRAATAAAWMNLISEYAGGAQASAGEREDWFPQPVPITVQIGHKKSMPLLVLPVPVPGECPASAPASAPASSVRPSESVPQAVTTRDYTPNPARPYWQHTPQTPYTPQTSYTKHTPASVPSAPSHRLSSPEVEVVDLPRFVIYDSSKELVELFQEQGPTNPSLPPMLLPARSFVSPPPPSPQQAPSSPPRPFAPALSASFRSAPAPPSAALPSALLNSAAFLSSSLRGAAGGRRVTRAAPTDSPPAPRFTRSLYLRGTLTVPRSDYTETFTVWWEASSGAARVDLFDGATSTYRDILLNGEVQGLEVHVDRTGPLAVTRCARSLPRRAAPLDHAPPALPHFDLFTFAGYRDTVSGRAEVWNLTIVSREGEQGAVRGESLTYRHEALLLRDNDDTITPLEYNVVVHSTVLGDNIEGYQFRYNELRYESPEHTTLTPNTEVCEETTETEQLEVVEPLREYTLPTRDPRYDEEHARYKTKYGARYIDDVEESLRKTLLIGSSRFIGAANRQSGPSNVEVNFLADRLDVERRLLLGVGGPQGLGLPDLDEQDNNRRRRDAELLPRNFDWRREGGVTRVKNQGATCQSCWAFAVSGAVEGALFVRTGRLEPLSEQQLIDCSKPYGGRGCKPTFPHSAYDYIQHEGIYAENNYIPYMGKRLACVSPGVKRATFISGHVNVTSNDERALKRAIRRNGPNVVLVDGANHAFIFHKKGVLYDDRCGKDASNHAVLAVGWGEHNEDSFFVVKNSWSEAWGDGGYIRMYAPSNTCGVLTSPSYPVLNDDDVTRNQTRRIKRTFRRKLTTSPPQL